MKKTLGLILPIVLAAVLLYFAYRKTDFGELWAQARTVHLIPVIGTFLSTFLAHWIRALRWNMLFEPVGFKPSGTNNFLAVMSGYFANLLIPRAGEVTRCTVLFSLNRIPIQTSLGTVLAERGLDLVMLLLIALLALGLEFETLLQFYTTMQGKYGGGGGPSIGLLLGVAAAVMAVLFAFRAHLVQIPLIRRVLEFGMGLVEGLLSATRMKKPVLFFTYTVSIWLCYFITTLISLSMFDFSADLGVRAAFMLLIVGSFGIVIPVPGVVGGPFQLFVAAALVNIYGKEEGLSTTASSMMYWTQTLFTLVLGGICYLLTVAKANTKTT